MFPFEFAGGSEQSHSTIRIWSRQGLALHNKDARARRSIRAGNRGSYERCAAGATYSRSESAHLLILYIEGLTGHEVEISPLAAVPLEARIADGRTIHLPSVVSEFADDELDFRLYKVLAAHAAGQIEFGTYEKGTAPLKSAYATLAETYNPENADALAAFSLLMRWLAYRDPATTLRCREGGMSTTQALHCFSSTARSRICNTLNGRIDRSLRENIGARAILI